MDLYKIKSTLMKNNSEIIKTFKKPQRSGKSRKIISNKVSSNLKGETIDKSIDKNVKKSLFSKVIKIGNKDNKIKSSLSESKIQKGNKKNNNKKDFKMPKETIKNQSSNKINIKGKEIPPLKIIEYSPKSYKRRLDSPSSDRSKETSSTNLETVSSERNRKKELIVRTFNNEKEFILERKEIKNKVKLKDVKSIDRIKQKNKEFTYLKERRNKFNNFNQASRRQSEKAIDIHKHLQKMRSIRICQYNDYIKYVEKKRIEEKNKPKEYNENKVNRIQRVYRSFVIRRINQILNRKKINLCLIEVFCLLLNRAVNNYLKKEAFEIIKLYYHEPFCDIKEEMDFTDKINIKYNNRHYIFRSFRIKRRLFRKGIRRRKRIIKKKA